MESKETGGQVERPNESNRKPERSGKRLLSVGEAAFYLSISPRTLYSAVAPKSKKPFPVKPKRMGKLVRFDIRDLDRYVDALDSGSTEGL